MPLLLIYFESDNIYHWTLNKLVTVTYKDMINLGNNFK